MRLFLYPRKKRLFRLCSIFMLAVTSQGVWADSACYSTQYDETTSVKYIHDGDTLHLKNGRKVRLIGINTPEIAHDDKPAEAFSYEAKDALQALLHDNKTIYLVYGNEKHDRYKRLLAHAFTSDGENIQAILLARGLARAITFPPNTRFSACYELQERKARCAKTGLWQKTSLLAADDISDNDTGFQLITGKLIDINNNRKGIWLNIDNRLSIGIRPDNQPLFDIDTLSELLDKSIVVRGWLNKSKRQTPYYMRIRHPSSIQPAETFSCDRDAASKNP